MESKKPMGGKRPGAGRKPGKPNKKTVQKQEQQRIFEEYILSSVLKEKKGIIDALIKKAKEGNVLAAKELMDRVLGKAKESVDLTSGGEALTITVMDYQSGKRQVLQSDKDKEDGK